MMFLWFGEVIAESEAGTYNAQVDQSFRMGMMWFILSEVMFFACFFGALFYARQLSLPWLGGEGSDPVTNMFLWPEFENTWPSNGPARLGGDYEIMGAWGIPALNTAILLTSGVTITIAHHALKANQRGVLNLFLALTVILGFIFLGFQAYEYSHAYTELNLKLNTAGIYGSTFFMLTGFHGLHVTIGAIMLTVILAPLPEGPLHPRPALRLRGRGLVLALRRRGVAGPVHLRLLALMRHVGAPSGATGGYHGRTRSPSRLKARQPGFAPGGGPTAASRRGAGWRRSARRPAGRGRAARTA